MWQKPHERVHTSPRIISVAVPAFQHSPMFGHLALSQTVCSRWSCTSRLSLANPSPAGIFIFSHAGLRACAGAGAGESIDAPPLISRWLSETFIEMMHHRDDVADRKTTPRRAIVATDASPWEERSHTHVRSWDATAPRPRSTHQTLI